MAKKYVLPPALPGCVERTTPCVFDPAKPRPDAVTITPMVASGGDRAEMRLGMSSTPEPPDRLAVDFARKTITLDGMTYDVGSDLALRWVAVLAKHPGEWISGPELPFHDSELTGSRPHRFRKYLPDSIRCLIESDRRKGSRLTLA